MGFLGRVDFGCEHFCYVICPYFSLWILLLYLLVQPLSVKLLVVVLFHCLCPDVAFSSIVAPSLSFLGASYFMVAVGSRFWFGCRFVLPLCWDAPFSDSIACVCCNFSIGGSCALFLSLLVGIVMGCDLFCPVYWSSSFPACPLSWSFRSVCSLLRICNTLGSRLESFCAQGWPCGGVGRWLDHCIDFVCLPPLCLLVSFPVGASISVLSSSLAVLCQPRYVACQQWPGCWIRFLLWSRLDLCWCWTSYW